MVRVSFLWRGFAAAFLVSSFSVAHAEGAPEMVARKVSPSTWYVEGLSALGTSVNQNFISNAAFVVTPAGVVVIDAS